jgi:hypothetical protein
MLKTSHATPTHVVLHQMYSVLPMCSATIGPSHRLCECDFQPLCGWISAAGTRQFTSSAATVSYSTETPHWNPHPHRIRHCGGEKRWHAAIITWYTRLVTMNYPGFAGNLRGRQILGNLRGRRAGRCAPAAGRCRPRPSRPSRHSVGCGWRARCRRRASQWSGSAAAQHIARVGPYRGPSPGL